MVTTQAALLKDSGLPIGKAAAIAKLATSEVATRVSHQVKEHGITLGGYLNLSGQYGNCHVCHQHHDHLVAHDDAGDATDGPGGYGEGEWGGEELQGCKVVKSS